MKKNIAILLFSIIFIVTACKKEGDTVSADTAKITIASPVEGAVFNKNEAVKISAVGSYTKSLHGYEVTIHPVNDTTAIFRKVSHTHALSLDVNEEWVNTSPAAKNQVVEVKIIIDHDGNFLAQKVNITCN